METVRQSTTAKSFSAGAERMIVTLSDVMQGSCVPNIWFQFDRCDGDATQSPRETSNKQGMMAWESLFVGFGAV